MKKGKSKLDITRYYDSKIFLLQNSTTLKYDRKRDVESADRDSYRNAKRDKEILAKEKRIEEERRKALMNFEREEKGNKAIKYKNVRSKKQAFTKTKVLDILQLLSRVRDCDTNGNVDCISCGTRYRRDELCGGHYQVATLNSTSFDMRNINAQCSKCNGAMYEGGIQGKRVEAIYKDNLRKKLGDIEFGDLETIINQTLHTPNEIPPKRRLQELVERGEQEILKHIKGKYIEPKKGTLLYKILQKHVLKQE